MLFRESAKLQNQRRFLFKFSDKCSKDGMVGEERLEAI